MTFLIVFYKSSEGIKKKIKTRNKTGSLLQIVEKP